MITSADGHKLFLENSSSKRVSQSFERAEEFCLQVLSQVSGRMTDGIRPAADRMTKTVKQQTWGRTETSVHRMTEVKEEAVGRVAETAEQARNALTDAIDRAADSLGVTLQKAERLNHGVSDSIQAAIGSLVEEWIDSVKVWIDSHPLVFWMVQIMGWGFDHPILALVAALLVVSTLSGLLKVLGRLIEKAWILVLQAPLKLGQLLLGASSKSLSRLGNGLKSPSLNQSLGELDSQAGKHEQRERLARILIRLEEISQEQNQLLQEVAAIVALEKQA